MKNLLSILIYCAYSLMHAQAPPLVWANFLPGPNLNEGVSIVVDPLGNVYTTGHFMGSVDCDPGPGVYNLTNSGSQDIYISKLDAQGNFLWAKSIGGPIADIVKAIALDASGNVCIVGFYDGVMTCGPFTLFNGGSSDAFVCKLNSSGTFLWAVRISGAGSEACRDVTFDINGNVLCVGEFSGTPDFDPGPGTYNMTSAGVYDVYVLKLNPSGNFIWAKQFASPNSEWGESITSDSQGNVITCGEFSANTDFDPGPGTYTLSYLGLEMFISKLDASGNFMWAGAMGGVGNDRVYSVTCDVANNFYFTGTYENTTDFDPGPGTFNLSSNGVGDVFIAKINSSGNFVWAKAMGSSGQEEGRAITYALGYVYAAGYFVNVVDFDTGPSVMNYTAVGAQDIYISKHDTAGNFIYTAFLSGGGGEAPNDVAGDANGFVYSTGFFDQTVDFDPTAGVYNISASNFTDTYNIKLGTCSVHPPDPISTTSSAQQTLCSGKSTTLTASGIPLANLNWYSSPTSTTILTVGNTFVTPTLSAGTYTFYVEAMTCTTSINRTAVSLTVMPLPTLSIVATSSLLCSGNMGTLTVSGANTYTWSTGSNFTQLFVNPFITTNYSVTGTNGIGCKNTTVHTQSVAPLPTLTVSASPTLVCVGGTTTLSAIGATSYTWNTNAFTQQISVTLTNSATYTVTGTDANGCKNSSVFSLTVASLPPLNIVASPSVVCIGGTGTLSASGANSYTWNTNASTQQISVTPTTTTSYSVTGTDLNGCKNSYSFSLMVSGLPTVNIVASSSVICAEQPATLTAIGASNYTWSTGSNSTQIVVTPSTSTIYTLTGTNIYGCVNSSSMMIIISLCTGKQEFENFKNNIRCYPNPASLEFYIDQLGGSAQATVNVYDLNGKLVLSQEMRGKTIINTSNLMEGIYNVSIKQADGIVSVKMVVVH